MVALNGTFDASQVDPNTDFPVLPKGDYRIQIVSSEVRENKTPGTGSHLRLEYEVMEGQYAKQKLFSQLNLWHANPEAVNMAQKEFSQICHAIGHLQVSDTDVLHGKPVIGKIIIVKDQHGEDRNDIKKIEADPVYGNGKKEYTEAPEASKPPSENSSVNNTHRDNKSDQGPWAR